MTVATRRRGLLPAVLAVVALAALGVGPARVMAADDEPLTTAAAVARSALAQDDKPPAVDLEAVVTHRDTAGTIFLRDDTGATFIASDQKTPVIPPGERVRVEGVVHRGLFINGIRHSRIERRGGGPRAEPKPITPQQLAAGGLHYEWVSLEGVGRRWRGSGDGGGVLTLNVGGGIVEARLERANVGAGTPSWIGAQLRVQGIAAGEINDRRQLIRPYLLVPDGDDIAMLEPAPPDPFVIPETSFSGLGRGEPSGRLQRVAGMAVAAPRGRRLFLNDGSDGLCVLLADEESGDTAAINAGNRVEAVGFAEPGGLTPSRFLYQCS